MLLPLQLYNGSHRSLPSSNAHPRPIGWGEGRGEGSFLVFSANGKVVLAAPINVGGQSVFPTFGRIPRAGGGIFRLRRRTRAAGKHGHQQGQKQKKSSRQ